MVYTLGGFCGIIFDKKFFTTSWDKKKLRAYVEHLLHALSLFFVQYSIVGLFTYTAEKQKTLINNELFYNTKLAITNIIQHSSN
jgi:hypothetical protein